MAKLGEIAKFFGRTMNENVERAIAQIYSAFGVDPTSVEGSLTIDDLDEKIIELCAADEADQFKDFPVIFTSMLRSADQGLCPSEYSWDSMLYFINHTIDFPFGFIPAHAPEEKNSSGGLRLSIPATSAICNALKLIADRKWTVDEMGELHEAQEYWCSSPTS